MGTLYAELETPDLTPENAKSTKITATAMIRGEEIVRQVNNLGEIKLAGKPKVLARVVSSDPRAAAPTLEKPLELVIRPGQTISAQVRVERNEFAGRISFGNADSGRNLPHGVYVDNIGLNGLLIVEGQSERTFFITADKGAREMTRLFHLRATVEGNQTSWPVILHVRRDADLASATE